jgi:hypothetical protein
MYRERSPSFDQQSLSWTAKDRLGVAQSVPIACLSRPQRGPGVRRRWEGSPHGEGTAETLTRMRLGIDGQLAKTPCSTNLVRPGGGIG